MSKRNGVGGNEEPLPRAAQKRHLEGQGGLAEAEVLSRHETVQENVDACETRVSEMHQPVAGNGKA